MNGLIRDELTKRIKAIDAGLVSTLWATEAVPAMLEGVTITTGGTPCSDSYDAILTATGKIRLVVVNEQEKDITPVLADLTTTPLRIDPTPDTPTSWFVKGMISGIDEQRDEGGMLYTSILLDCTATLHRALDTAYTPQEIQAVHDAD